MAIRGSRDLLSREYLVPRTAVPEATCDFSEFEFDVVVDDQSVISGGFPQTKRANSSGHQLKSRSLCYNVNYFNQSIKLIYRNKVWVQFKMILLIPKLA